MNRGAAYVMLMRFEDAVNDLPRGLALGTTSPQVACYDRGVAHEQLGDIKGAYLDYKQAVEVAPDFQLAIQELKRFKVVRRPAGDSP